MYFWLTDPQGKKGLKTTSAGSQGYALDRSVASPLSCPAVFCPLSARRFQSKGKQFQLVWYTYPIRKICCLHCMGCSVIIIGGGIGHDWAALAEMGVGWHWNTKVTWKSKVAGFWCVTDFDTKYLRQRGMSLLHWSHQHSGQIRCVRDTTVSCRIAKILYQTTRG